ncbi:hypothetical protein AC578_2627 [Pseudocercospora eumusae]|uniref:Peptidase C13 family protein n=1 Tax=Pseudocercospora eumusae TaxID=321146 RepID=A0A139H7V2_9PEZI|nr:hypothetical protein AC578_2627 [Pseudocercospora eumusae]
MAETEPMTSELEVAQEQYLTEACKKENVCDSDDTARPMLEQNNWSVDVAGRVYRQQKLVPPPLSHAETYDTTNPPIVEKKSIVIGLLGTIDRDRDDTASPEGDGWFISDFYLWKHVLKGMGSEQIWMTCLDPQYLCEKYVLGGHGANKSWSDGYIHGRPTAERVVVLDEATLPFAKKDLKLCKETSLLNEYLETLESKFADAQKTNRPIVLLMFGHGDIENCGDKKGGLQIAIEDPSKASQADFLTADKIVDIHSRYPEVRLTLFMTSCYSGYWVATPYFKAAENINIIAGAREWEQTHSWKQSSSLRHAGGVFSSGFLEELKQEPSDPSQHHEAREYQHFVRDLAASVPGLSVDETVERGLASLPSFTPSTTSEKFYARTGYELHHYKKNYDGLKRIPASRMERERDRTGGSSSSSGSYGPGRRLARAVSYLATKYKRSKIGRRK